MSAHIHTYTKGLASLALLYCMYDRVCVCTSLRMTLWQTHLRIVAYSSDAAILHKLWVYSLSLCISFLRNLSTCWEAVLYVFVSRCPCSVGWDSGVFFFKLSRKTFPLLLLTSPHEDWVWILCSVNPILFHRCKFQVHVVTNRTSCCLCVTKRLPLST